MGLFIGLRDEDVLRDLTPLLGNVRLSNSGDSIHVYCSAGRFTLREVSGPVAASVELYVLPDYRRKGWADRFEEAKMMICRLADVELLIATVNKENTAELAALAKHSWVQEYELRNVYVYSKRIGQVQTLTRPIA